VLVEPEELLKEHREDAGPHAQQLAGRVRGGPLISVVQQSNVPLDAIPIRRFRGTIVIFGVVVPERGRVDVRREHQEQEQKSAHENEEGSGHTRRWDHPAAHVN
jgi:hypothetical protein